MNHPKTIAIDVDDVIIATAPAVISHYNQTYGTNATLKDIYSKDAHAWGVDDYRVAVQRFERFLLTPEYQQLAPFTEAIDALQKLKARYTLDIVTGRPDFLADVTRDMLSKHFPDIFRSVEFTNFVGKTPRPKSLVCQQLGADMLIDDHLGHALTVAECGIPVLLFGDYPWNQTDDLPTNIQRVRDWPDVVRILGAAA